MAKHLEEMGLAAAVKTAHQAAVAWSNSHCQDMTPDANQTIFILALAYEVLKLVTYVSISLALAASRTAQHRRSQFRYGRIALEKFSIFHQSFPPL
jgi:CxxC motif-containing protein (DUF1111 family)